MNDLRISTYYVPYIFGYYGWGEIFLIQLEEDRKLLLLKPNCKSQQTTDCCKQYLITNLIGDGRAIYSSLPLILGFRISGPDN